MEDLVTIYFPLLHTGLIIVAAKYSTRLTELLGDKAVPVLDTLFLLSYMKLLQIVVATLEVSHLTHTYQNLTSTQHVHGMVSGWKLRIPLF